MDMHVEDRFRGHRRVRGERVSLPGQVCHVMVATRGCTPWFDDFHVACEAVRAFRQPVALADATLLAWVLMPAHAHWLVELGSQVPLEALVSRMKASAGVLVNRMLFRAGPLWEPAFHGRVLAPVDDVRVVARHIIGGPLRAGLVERIGDYPFWDCVWLPPTAP